MQIYCNTFLYNMFNLAAIVYIDLSSHNVLSHKNPKINNDPN